MSEATLKQPIATGSNITEELVILLRGFFATPVITALGHHGALAEIAKRSVFTAADLTKIPNKQLLNYTFEYLARIGLMICVDAGTQKYQTTDLGRQVFQRVNSFYAPHSYHLYVHAYRDQLMHKGSYQKQDVDRLENIIGSGRTHERYFPPAVSFLKRKVKFDLMADIGCGDGRFLEFVLKGVPNIEAVGIDLSEVSTQTTKKNLQQKFPGCKIDTICADASDVKKWSESLTALAGKRKLAISMWFLLHEISGRDPKNVICFLNQIHEIYPDAPIIICELVRQDADLLSKYRKEIIMPEYLLFHDISLQGVLSWHEYQNVLQKIPYKVAMERVFDEISDDAGNKQPATFVWALTPR